jgi:hypothetical protein
MVVVGVAAHLLLGQMACLPQAEEMAVRELPPLLLAHRLLMLVAVEEVASMVTQQERVVLAAVEMVH